MSLASLPVVEIDVAAIHHNVSLIRKLAGPGVSLYAVVKGDAYGIGAVHAAGALIGAGADALAAGDTDQSLSLRANFPDFPIMVYGTYLPSSIPLFAQHRIWPTLYSLECVDEACRVTEPLTVFIEVDCGFGRLGLLPSEVEGATKKLSAFHNVKVKGIYTHLGAITDADAMRKQMASFQTVAASVETLLGRSVEKMVASSRVLIDKPEWALDAVNPGRLLFGMVEEPWGSRIDLQPAISSVRSRVIQTKRIRSDTFFGYGVSTGDAEFLRVGVAVIGFAGGLPREVSGMSVIVRGRKVGIIGLASMEHLLLDLAGHPDVQQGDEVVIIGSQGDVHISGAEFARSIGLTELEAVPRLARGLRRIYSD